MAEHDGIRRLPPAARFILQGGRPVREAAGQAFGLALPEEACRAHADAERAALWLGPDEHLLLAPAGQKPNACRRNSTRRFKGLRIPWWTSASARSASP